MTIDLKDFDDLINLGRVTHTVNLGKHEITLSTLNSDEYAAAMRFVPQQQEGKASVLESDMLESMQREIVVAAIKKIDGKELSREEKISIVNAGQLALSNLFYSEYLKMVDEQGEILEGAKKNSFQAQKPSKTLEVAPVSS